MGAGVKISIIIPVYNVEKYLRECLDSILNQTFRDFELICVDDGSTDKSLEILEEYKNRDNRIIILKQPHSGAASARNLGIKFAQGKYLQFLDADDWFEPQMLDELFSRAEKFNADMVVCSARKFDEEGRLLESGNPNFAVDFNIVPQDTPFCPKDFGDDMFMLFNAVPWIKLVNKNVIIDNQLEFQNLPCCNDVAFSLKLAACVNRVIAFNKELINRRYGRAGSIAKLRAERADCIIRVYMEVKRFLKERGVYNNLKKAFLYSIKKSISWEISLCNDEQYEKFLINLKTLLPDSWEIFKPALRHDYITLDYLNKYIGKKKVLLWGASLFIQKVLEDEESPNPNILGFVDRNKIRQGEFCGSYKIYPPEAINELKPDGVLMTILSGHERVYEGLKKEFNEKYPNVELLPNIFNGEV